MSLSKSPRSSVTVLDDDDIAARNAEQRLESYGGDDVRDPPLSTEHLSHEDAHSTITAVDPAAPYPDPNLVTWDGPHDPANPQNWSTRYKWFITALCSLITINVTFASSAPTAASEVIAAQFQTTPELARLITSVFLFGYIVGPLLWGPGSELFGRRPVFVLSMAAYTLLFLGQALARDMRTLLVTRFFGGVFAVAPLTICGGTIADMWDAVGRGRATSVFTASVFLGPVLGPLAGGFVVENMIGWRWIFWIMIIFAGFCTTVIIIFLPETYAPVLLQKKAKRLRAAIVDSEKAEMLYAEHERQDWSLRGVLHRTIYRPFYMLLHEPILVLITVYLSLVYGLLYALFEAYPIIFIIKRHLSVSQTGLTFLGVGIGTTLGAAMNLLLTRHYPRLLKEWRGSPPPEERLWGAMVGAPGLVVGVFWLGWTGEYERVSWAAPAASGIVLGMSVILIFISFLSYLIDTYMMYSASAFAANTIVRSAVGAAFPLFTVQMFTNLGVNWAATLLGLVGLVLAPSPFLFYRFGAKVRRRSRFAPSLDLRIAEEREREREEEKERVRSAEGPRAV